MKTRMFILSVAILATSCDPDVAGEKITLPPMEFAFKVNPDTSVLSIGDTFSIHAGLSTTLNNGIKLEDGHGEIGIFVSRGDSIPKISENDIFTALNNVDYKLIVEGGGVKFATGDPNQLIRITSNPTGDSLIMSYKFIFLKKGLFRLNVGSSSFFEGSKGKARWSARFDVSNPNWDTFWRVTGSPMPQPSEDHYYRNYLIAVTQ